MCSVPQLSVGRFLSEASSSIPLKDKSRSPFSGNLQSPDSLPLCDLVLAGAVPREKRKRPRSRSPQPEVFLCSERTEQDTRHNQAGWACGVSPLPRVVSRTLDFEAGTLRHRETTLRTVRLAAQRRHTEGKRKRDGHRQRAEEAENAPRARGLARSSHSVEKRLRKQGGRRSHGRLR